MRALDAQGRGLADAEATGTRSPALEPASPSGEGQTAHGEGRPGAGRRPWRGRPSATASSGDGRHPACPELEGWRVCASTRPGWGRHTGTRGTPRWLGVRWPDAPESDLGRKAKQDSDASPARVGQPRGDSGQPAWASSRQRAWAQKEREAGPEEGPRASPCPRASAAPPHTHVRAHLLHSTLACRALAHASVT